MVSACLHLIGVNKSVASKFMSRTFLAGVLISFHKQDSLFRILNTQACESRVPFSIDYNKSIYDCNVDSL